MPKIYFFDLGLRNFFIKNFKPFNEREDKGSLLENALFRQLIEKYDFEEIRFWRTIQKNEVDFVIDEKLAFEVKSQPKEFKETKYKVFLKNYPKIDFSIVSFDVKKKFAGSHQIFEVYRI